MDPMPFLSSNQQYQDTEGNSKPNPNWPHSWPHPFSLSTTGLVREGEWSLYASCLMPVPWQCIAHRQLTTMWYNKITCTKTKSIASQLGMASTKHAHMLIYGPIRIHTITNSVKFCEQCICRCEVFLLPSSANIAVIIRLLFVLCHHCCSSAATSRRHCFSHCTFHHSVQLCDRL